MATYGPIRALTYQAGEPLLGDRHKHVLRLSGPGTVKLANNPAGGEDSIEGIAWSKSNSGGSIAVAVKGECIVVAGGAIEAGVRLTTTSSGRAIAASSGHWTFGVSQEAAGFDGEEIRVLLQIPSVRLTF